MTDHTTLEADHQRLRQAIAPFVRYARLALAMARDDTDILFGLDDARITAGDARRLVEADRGAPPDREAEHQRLVAEHQALHDACRAMSEALTDERAKRQAAERRIHEAVQRLRGNEPAAAVLAALEER